MSVCLSMCSSSLGLSLCALVSMCVCLSDSLSIFEVFSNHRPIPNKGLTKLIRSNAQDIVYSFCSRRGKNMTYFVFLFVQYSDREGKNKNFISIIFKFLLHCYQHGEKSFLSFLNLISTCKTFKITQDNGFM